MRSRNAGELVRRSGERAQENNRGVGETLMAMASQRVMETQIGNHASLPVAYNDGSDNALQNSAGVFLYLEGYSDPAGTDIGAPGGG